ncbi:hypothetical protein C0995_012680 [Termitomyces sp. Mi166|nr:hypothetical protein C0995_012680 [Termitomyces sp. Mi166\
MLRPRNGRYHTLLSPQTSDLIDIATPNSVKTRKGFRYELVFSDKLDVDGHGKLSTYSRTLQAITTPNRWEQDVIELENALFFEWVY